MNTQGGSKVVQFKLVLLGDSAVGKSSLVLRFVRGQFFEYQESTIGAAFLTQNVSLNDYTVKFEIWDTAGQERYHSLAPMYYRGAAAAVVVYDITNAESFARAKSWVKELQRQGSPNIVIALAGNKCDLASKRKVEAAEATEYAKDSGLFFMETSAKAALNVEELFKAIAKKLTENMAVCFESFEKCGEELPAELKKDLKEVKDTAKAVPMEVPTEVPMEVPTDPSAIKEDASKEDASKDQTPSS